MATKKRKPTKRVQPCWLERRLKANPETVMLALAVLPEVVKLAGRVLVFLAASPAVKLILDKINR